MTNEQINAIIATSIGFIEEEPLLNGKKCWVHIDYPNMGLVDIPDYCNDLNAMHEAMLLHPNRNSRQREYNTTMNSYQRQLIDKLITELTDNASPNLHAAQMLAAELKGAMQSTCDHCDAPPFTQPDYPTPDADGWVENKGVDPKCKISAVKVSGKIHKYNSVDSAVFAWEKEYSNMSHYKPA